MSYLINVFNFLAYYEVRLYVFGSDFVNGQDEDKYMSHGGGAKYYKIIEFYVGK